MNDIILQELKKIIKVNRLKAKLNYKQLSELSGISDQMIRKYENDVLLDIPIGKYIHLLKVLNVSPIELIQVLHIFY
ncbi:MAG: helix-turn-helix domain-containing protein [Proteobacteria bacterium]|jgi:transcriptional regulator with XRE-family HTH domain|nr:helix-turn-helix domain-containing protein [Pseudomonadota bacterium]